VKLILFVLSLVSFEPIFAHAYPEMARAGYVNCNSCHISVNGGGILNDYGRELSKEELAVWKSKDESLSPCLRNVSFSTSCSMVSWGIDLGQKRCTHHLLR